MSEKLFNRLMIIDGSYMMHRNLKIEELFELRTSSSNTRSGGVFGFLRSLNYCLMNDYFPIITWDSKVNQRRLDIYPDYKGSISKGKSYQIGSEADNIVAGSTTIDEVSNKLKLNDAELVSLKELVDKMMQCKLRYGNPHDDDYMYQYVKQRSAVINICNELGIPSIKISGQEGDDLMCLLSRMSNKSIIITDDKDLLQLLSPDISVNRVMKGEFVEYDKYLKDNNMSSIREMIIIKAIVGDGSDNIPGVTAGEERMYCCGSTTAAKIAKVIIECGEDPQLYVPKLSDMTSEGRDRNKIKGFLMHHDIYLRNMQLVDLSLVPNDSLLLSNIVSEVNKTKDHIDMFKAISKLREYEINEFDINKCIEKVKNSSQYCFIN